MGKHVEKVGSLENFNAPWETAAGEVEIDKARLKQYIFNLVLDKAKAQDARDESTSRVAVLESDLEKAKADLAAGDTDGKIAKLEKDLAQAKGEAAKASLAFDRLEVGLEKGLTPKQAARLQGANREELAADADEILETFGVQKATTEDDDDDDDDDEGNLGTEPVIGGLVNPGSRKAAEGADLDYDKIVSGFGSKITI